MSPGRAISRPRPFSKCTDSARRPPHGPELRRWLRQAGDSALVDACDGGDSFLSSKPFSELHNVQRPARWSPHHGSHDLAHCLSRHGPLHFSDLPSVRQGWEQDRWQQLGISSWSSF